MIELLYRALASKFGIRVTTNDAQLLRQRLYVERRRAANPALDTLILSPSRANPDTELWIINPPKEEPPHAEEV